MALLAALLAAPVASAGTLCGTVRDASTAGPLAGALVLAYQTDGAWSGSSGITGINGTFCIDPIPPGTYDLQVHVRDHLVATLKNVVVTDVVTGIDLDGVLPALALRVFPNPARSSTRIAFQAGEAARAEVGVYDLRGRFLRGWSAGSGLAAGRDVTWDFRDRDGREVPAGIYFVRLSTETGAVVRQVVRLP